MNDQEILKGILQNNRTVIKTFYKDNLRYIRKYIVQNSGNKEDVEDVFQDALVIVYEKLLSDTLEIHASASLRSYFFGICKNLWQKRLSKKSKIVHTAAPLEESVPETILDEIDDKERGQLYSKYFLRLSEACQKLLLLVFEDKSMREIGEVTGYSEMYSRRKKFKCKKALMEQIEADPLYEELKLYDAKKEGV